MQRRGCSASLICHAEAELQDKPGRAVRGHVTHVRGVGGEMFTRTLYHLPSDDSFLMLNLREVVKVGQPIPQATRPQLSLCSAAPIRAVHRIQMRTVSPVLCAP